MVYRINPIRSRALAERYSITSLLYPLFEPIETIIAQLVSPQHLVATQAVVTSGRILIEKRMEGSKGKSTPRVSDLKNLLDKIELALPKIESRPILPLPQDTTAPPSSSTSDWRDVLSNKINRKLEASSLSSTDSKYTFGSLDLTTSALPDIDFTTPRLAFDLTSFDSKSRRNTCPHIDYTPLTTPKLSPTSPLSPLPIDLPIVFPEGFDPSSIRRSLDSNSTATGGSLVGVESRSGKRRFSDVSAALTLTRLSHSDLTVAPKVEVESKIEEGKVKDKEDKCTKDITRKLKKAKTVKEENFRASKIASQSFESSFDPPVSTSIPLAFYSHPGTSYNGASPVDTTRPYPFPPLPPSLPQRYQSPVQSEQYFPPLPSVISSIMSTNLPPTLPYYNDSNTQAYRSNTLGYAPNHRQSNNSNLSPTNSLPPQHNPTQFHPHYLQTQPPPLPLWNYQATYTQTYSAQNPAPTSLPQTQSIVPVGNPYPPVAYRDGYSLPSSQYNYRSQPQYATYPPPTSVSNYPHPQVQARHSFPPRQSQPQPQSQSQPRPQSQNIPLPPMSPYPFPQYNSTIDERYQYQNQIRRNQEVVEQQQQQQGERVRNNPGSRGDSIGDVFGAQSKNEKRLWVMIGWSGVENVEEYFV